MQSAYFIAMPDLITMLQLPPAKAKKKALDSIRLFFLCVRMIYALKGVTSG